MKIYRIANGIDKSIKWECPITGIYLVAHYIDGDPINYELYCADKSFVDTFDNFYHAANWAKKHLDPKCKIPRAGVRI